MARILVVEDEYIVALDIKKHLERFGHAVPGIYASADELFRSLEAAQPDLVIMDIKIQGDLDGVQASAILNERHRIPVILLTAYADDETIQRAKISQPFGYIIKPFEERELKTAVEIALYRHEMERKLRDRDDQLRQAQKMEAIGRLAGGVAHDFNNIITAVLGYANLLSGQGGHSEEVAEDIEGIKTAALKAAALTRQLLAFSRHQMLNPKALDANATLVDMEKMLRRLVSEEIGLSVVINAGQPAVYVDSSQFEQVIINLVVNARDAMPSGGSLRLSTANKRFDEPSGILFGELPSGEYVEIKVQDSGEGIPAELLERIFEPFFTTKDKEHGTGLGLSTVYGIVTQSKGYVRVESEEGKGSCFTILLPVYSGAREQAVAAAAPAPAGGRGERILLVEDEEYLQKLVTRVLSGSGYEVLTAANSGEAILICEGGRERIDLLLTDVVLPFLNGFKLAERLRLERPSLRCLFMSGYAGRFDDATSSQQLALLHKPFDNAELLRRVRETLDAPA